MIHNWLSNWGVSTNVDMYALEIVEIRQDYSTLLHYWKMMIMLLDISSTLSIKCPVMKAPINGVSLSNRVDSLCEQLTVLLPDTVIRACFVHESQLHNKVLNNAKDIWVWAIVNISMALAGVVCCFCRKIHLCGHNILPKHVTEFFWMNIENFSSVSEWQTKSSITFAEN